MKETTMPATTAPVDRKYLLERVGEAAVVQLYADAFRDLPLREKTLVWHLAQAAPNRVTQDRDLCPHGTSV